MQYAVFVINTTTGSGSSAVTKSALYEVNVATGQPATGTVLSAALSALPSGTYVNSSLTYVPTTGTLFFGDNNGGVWSVNISGTAQNDASGATQVATTSPAAAINYVGYTEINGLPYIWAATAGEITTFALSGGSSNILWASSGTSGYQPNSSGTLTAVSSTTVMPLQSGGQISAAPVLVNGVLVVPVYVPPSGSTCGVGTGYYDLFDLLTGNLPKITITYKNNAVVNGVIALGSGIPLSPAVYVTPTGTVIYPGSSRPPKPQSPNPISPIQFGGNVMNKPIAWRQY
jgi:type IV pilus assembly protein PilY1